MDTATGDIMADYTPPTGCVRSYVVEADQPGYGTELVEQCYVQDQGVAIGSMLAVGDTRTAELMVGGLLLMQTDGGLYDGGFIYSAAHMSPAYGVPAYRIGAHCVALYSLLRFIRIAPHGGKAVYRAAALRGLGFLEAYLCASGDLAGLYRGGDDVFSPDIRWSVRVNQAYDTTWADTESNLAAWWVLQYAASVFGEPYRSRAGLLRGRIMAVLWNGAERRFNRGQTDTGGPDTEDTLVAHTLGAVWLRANGVGGAASRLLQAG